MKSSRWLFAPVALACLTACGGGGGGTPTPPPTPTATLTANPTSVTVGGTVTLTWSSTNAAACTASGGWSGSRPVNGTEASPALSANATFTLTCGTAIATASVAVTQPVTVAVAGQLLVPGNVQTDSDTNDPLVTRVLNNSFATAQAIANPVMVGGYVTEAGAGPSGPLQATGDVSDYFSVSLVAGQTIELTVANPHPEDDDLDLELYSSNQTFVDESIGTSRVEQLTVPTTGQYFIRVIAYNGSSNYILSIGLNAASVSTLRLSREFVPGELVVKTREGGAGMQKAAIGAAASLDLEVVHTTPGLHSLMRIGATTQTALDKTRSQFSAKLNGGRYASDTQRLKSLTLHALKELAQRSDIEWAEPNWILHASAVPNDPLYARQRWHYEALQLPSAWDVTTGSTNVVAAVVDSGVRPHAELAARLVSPIDFVDDDLDASDPGTPAQGSYYFHGTHVAGTIGAAGNDGQGVTGVAWNVSIMPVRVLGSNGSGSFDDIVQGIVYAAGLTNSSGRLPAKRADVINLSLGALSTCPTGMQQALDAVRAAGSIVVAAAGNENTSSPSIPASCNGVISVSALDVGRQRAPYSNFGDTVDVAAPGGDTGADRDGDGYSDGIYSTHASRSGTTYAATHTYMQGTSMASPHVAGVIALMRSVNPNITPAQVDTLLSNGTITDDIGTPGRDSLGIGAINALKAVRAASTNPPAQPARLDAVPSTLNFGDVSVTQEVAISNGGSGPISVTSTATSAAWLTTSIIAPDPNGLGRYRIDANRAGLANGVHQGWVEYRSSPTSAVRVTVVLRVASTTFEPNAGQHYLLLIDPATRESKYQVEILARGATVPFSFAGVATGQYQLVVGSDANNDGFICDDGEACGQYPVYGEPRTITVTNAVSDLVVTTSYQTEVAPESASFDNDAERSGVQRVR